MKKSILRQSAAIVVICCTLLSVFSGCYAPKGASATNNNISNTEVYSKNNSSQIISSDLAGKIDPLVVKSSAPSVTGKGEITKEYVLECTRDEKGDRYYSRPELDFLCGFQKKSYYGFFEETPIGLDAAVKIAEEYLAKIIPDFDRYSLCLSEDSGSDALYLVRFCHMLNGIATDDMISVFVQENGEVGAFMSLNYNCFSDYTIDNKKFNSLPKDESTENQYITANSEGLILVRYLPVVKKEAEILVPKSYLIGELK